jgi:hypothetical protein
MVSLLRPDLLRTGTLLLALAGCAGGGDDPGPWVNSQDPDLLRRAAPLVAQLAERAGLPLREPVRVERRSREELLGYLRQRLDRDLPEEAARRTAEAYRLLGLFPPDLDLRELLLAIHAEQVAGFYDPDARTLYVLDDQPDESLDSLLLHELVHALQDQHVSLDSMTSPSLDNDRRMAARAAIEGHATLVMLAYLGEQRGGGGIPAEELPGLDALLRPDPANLSRQFPVLGSAPRIVRETLLFPYSSGAGFVQAVWRAREGRPAPFDELLPSSTEQVLAPGRLLNAPTDPPIAVSVAAPVGVSILLENTLGALETGILLEEVAHSAGAVAGPPEGGVHAGVGWGGDRWALLEGETGARSLLWVSVWDSEEERDAVFDRLGAGSAHFPEAVDLRICMVAGRPGVVLAVGALPGVGERACEPEGGE